MTIICRWYMVLQLFQQQYSVQFWDYYSDYGLLMIYSNYSFAGNSGGCGCFFYSMGSSKSFLLNKNAPQDRRGAAI